MDINDDNVLDVMRVADYLCIDDLVKICHEFVVECLGPENCVTLLQFAEYVIIDISSRDSRVKYVYFPTFLVFILYVHITISYYYFGALREESYKYIVKNFMTIAKLSDELMKLRQDEFKQIIGDDQLNIKHEENVREIIVKWADKDPENRKDEIASQLLKKIQDITST